MVLDRVWILTQSGDSLFWRATSPTPSCPISGGTLNDCLDAFNGGTFKSDFFNILGVSQASDLEAIAYSLISFGAVAIMGIIFHGFFIWLIAMLKPS